MLCWVATGGLEGDLFDFSRITHGYLAFSLITGSLWGGSFAAVYLRTESPARYELLWLVPMVLAFSAGLLFVAEIAWVIGFVAPKTGYP